MTTHPAAIFELVMETLRGPQAARPVAPIETLLIREGAFIGRKYRYDGGYAIWPIGGQSIEFYGDDGTLRKLVAIHPQRRVAAA